MMLTKISLLAKVTYYSNTGRMSPIYSGYKPPFIFENAKTAISGLVELLNVECLKPGTTENIYITFIQGIIDNEYFKPEVRFYFNEGKLRLGEGEIVAIIKK